MRILIIFCMLISAGGPLWAEYRVFTLHIIDHSTQTTRQVQSTLDPEQYTSVYPLKNGEEITYMETWRCRGRTDFFKAHCDNPKRARETASLPDQKPVPVPSQSPELLN